MTGLEEKLRLAGKRSCLKSLMKAYMKNFSKLSQDALEINLMVKEILKLEEVKKDEQKDR